MTVQKVIERVKKSDEFYHSEENQIIVQALEEVEQYRVFKEIFESQFSSEALKLLADKEEFTKWLERGKWIARKCDELNKEVEQYRALGTVEGFKSALDSSLEYYGLFKEYKAKCQEYAELGTVEELKEVMEKQVAKKPNELFRLDGALKGGKCPTCGRWINNGRHWMYCECGQALDWEEGGTSD